MKSRKGNLINIVLKKKRKKNNFHKTYTVNVTKLKQFYDKKGSSPLIFFLFIFFFVIQYDVCFFNYI